MDQTNFNQRLYTAQLRAVDLLTDLAVFYHVQNRPGQSAKLAALARTLHHRVDPLHQISNLAEQFGHLLASDRRMALSRDYARLLHLHSTGDYDL